MTVGQAGQLRAIGLASLTVLSVLIAGLAVPVGPVGTATAATTISSCTWINQSGTYTLSSDLQPSSASDLADDTCILINSSDVVLDGNGHTVDGSGVSGTYGIRVENTTPGASKTDPADQLDRVTVRSVTLDNWPGSVGLAGVNDTEVSSVVVRNTGSGVFYEYGHNTTITGLTATTGMSGYAVSLSNVDAATVSALTVERSGGDGFAIRTLNSPDVKIANNTIDDRNNPDAGHSSSPVAIRVGDSPGAIVTNNTIIGVDMRGILLLSPGGAGTGSPNAVVSDNAVIDAADQGIDVRRSDNVVIRHNDLNVTAGIRVADSSGVAIESNVLRHDTVSQYGVYLTGTSGTVIGENHILGPTTGIHIPDVDPEKVVGNRINATGWAIDVDGDASTSYAGFQIRDSVVTGGDIRLQDYQNVSITNTSVVNGRVQLGSNLGEVRNVTFADAVVTDNHQDAAVYVEGAADISIANVTAADGLDHALRILDASHVTVDGFSVTAQNDSDQNSWVRLVWLTSVDNSSFSGLVVADNPVTGDDASSFSDGKVNALDVRHTRDTRIENVVIRNNSHGSTPAIRVRGDSANVTLDTVEVATAESGAVAVADTTADVSASNLTVGAGGPTNTTLSFAATGVLVSATSSPPTNSQAAAIGRYFDATNLSSNAFLDLSLRYDATDVTSINESTLALWHHDGSSWSQLQGSAVDTGAQTISANVTAFSTFGGFGDSTAAPNPANFAVTIDSTNSPIDEGGTLTVDATIENTGDSSGTQSVSLSVGGTVRDSQAVTLASGATTSVTLSWTTAAGDGGSYTATVASENDSDATSVSIRQPASFGMTIDSTDSPITEGETLTVDATVENTGDTAGTQTVELLIDGVVQNSTTLTLASGETRTVSLSWATAEGDAGDYTATVTSENDSATAPVTVEAATPANLSVTISGSNSPVTEGEALTVDATVNNTGDANGTQTVTLSVDKTKRDSKTLTLAAGASTSTTFSWTTSDGDAGDYVATVASDNDSASVSVTVESASSGSSSGGSSTGGTAPSTSTPTPTATVTPTPAPTTSPTPAATATPTAAQTASPTATPTTTAGPPNTATTSPAATGTATATAEPTAIPTATETPGQPGFGLAIALLAITLFGLARRRS